MTTMSGTVVKSANDSFDYKYLELKNGLKALLISDPTYNCLATNLDSDESGTESDAATSESDNEESEETINQKLSAIAICVRSGSFCDPKEMEGLAHLVEHVITMGSDKFPKENDLDQYLTSRGGYQNAQTEYEYTLFEVEVQRKHFFGALKRMANFFIKPLLLTDSIDREIKPVDTEFHEAMNDDEVRVEQIINNAANRDHPFNRFAWGNSKSLKDGTDTQKLVKQFVDNHYKADNLHVVLQSQESMETLEDWVTELFSGIEPSNGEKTNKSGQTQVENLEKPFDNNPEFHKLYYVEPLHETDQLTILWSLPPIKTTKHYDCPALDYLSHVIGHEGKGSLISRLRKEHLALELSSGVEESGFANNKYSSLFAIQIKLTDLGKKKMDLIVNYTFKYLKIIETIGVQKWFFDELKNIEKNRFDWREEKSAIDCVKRIAINMNNIPIENVLRGSKLYSKFDEELIQSYMKLLTPNTACFIYLSTNCLKNDNSIKTEKWFGTQYKVLDVPKQWLQTQQTESGTPFHFPEKNPFIATDFTIKSKPIQPKPTKVYSKLDSKPTKVLDKSRLKLWFKLDDKFGLPKAIIKLHILSPLTYDNSVEQKIIVENSVMTDFFVEFLILILNEEVYSATTAGLRWNLSQSNCGLIVEISGFNHKIDVLLERVINRMINLELDENQFADIKKNLAKSYHNIFVEPINLNKGLRLSILSNRYINSVEKRSVIETIDLNKLEAFVKKFFSNFFVEALIEGNLTKEESIEMLNKVEAKLQLNSMSGHFEEPKLQAMEIPLGEFCCRVQSMSTNKNSAIINYYQLEPANIRLNCMTAILSSFMEEPSFNILRTKEGLGYHVWASDYDTYGVSAYGISVSSSGHKFDCSFVDQRIENFLKSMIEFFNNLKEEDYKQQLKSIIVAKKAPDLRLKEEFNRFWNEIVSFNYCFDRLEKEIKCLEKLTFKEFKDWALNEALKNTKKRKLSIQVVGNGKKSLTECLTFDGKQLESKNESDKADDSGMSEMCFKKFKITHLMSKNETNTKYIDDIPNFKKTLNMYPINKVVD